jgi:class 3 adenylate cyclase
MAQSAPSMTRDARFEQWVARHSRLAASPGAAAAIMRAYAEIDVRAAAEAVHVPSLILHRTGDLMCSVEQGRDLAARIPATTYVELPGADHLWHVGDTGALLAEVEQFLTRMRPAKARNRVLATILSAEIVGSAGRAVAVGDRKWQDLLQSYSALVSREFAYFGAREHVNASGIAEAAFDGPARAVECARAIADFARPLGIELRAGVHTGECEIVDGRLRGVAFEIAAAARTAATPAEILVSSTVKELVVGSGLMFEDRGARTFEGGHQWRLFALADRERRALGAAGSTRAASRAPDEALTPAEWEVLALLARGYTNPQIADERSVTLATVATQVHHILEKTGSANRIEAALWALRRGRPLRERVMGTSTLPR